MTSEKKDVPRAGCASAARAPSFAHAPGLCASPGGQGVVSHPQELKQYSPCASHVVIDKRLIATESCFTARAC